jgi:acetyl-CoA carboxylase carboxyl transferase subunit beta
MAWFNKTKAPLAPVETKKVQMPEGIWTKCKNCNEIIYTKEIERNLNVCPKCDYHFRISARERIALVLDEGSFVERDASMQSVDFLDFKDSKKYKDRIKAAVKKSGGDAVICGDGTIEGLPVAVAVFDFGFIGRQHGFGQSERRSPGDREGLAERKPVIIFFLRRRRTQESISLMQMARPAPPWPSSRPPVSPLFPFSPTRPPAESPPVSPCWGTSTWPSPGRSSVSPARG